MSWDILIQDLPNVALIEDIPSDFQPKPLGKRDEVVGRIASVFPDADFPAPLGGFWIERTGRLNSTSVSLPRVTV
jgi:hypothetical protein